MSIVRVEKRRRYTTVDRRAVNDGRLSFRARGILTWLLDKPNDWTATRETIAAASPDGLYAVRSALKELADHGYLVRTKRRLPNGRMVTETVVHEFPPEVENQPSENRPAVDRPAESQPAKDLVLRQRTETEKPSASPEADRIARAEWEKRDRKPVCGFPALRARIQDVLDAGHPIEAVEKALPSMSVFTRNSFDLALGQLREQRSNGHRPTAVERSWANNLELLAEMEGRS